MSKYALPTTDEMRQLHAADPSSVFQSTFFKLQIDQLLDEVSVNYSAFSSLNATLFALKETLDAIPAQQVTADALNLPGLVVRNHHKEVVLPFLPPARLDVIGSHSLRHGAQLGGTKSITVDVAVQLPDACFVPKDFMNYRYHDKRALYLGVLASNLQDAVEGDHWTSLALTSFAGDRTKPILRLTSKKIKHTQVYIHIVPVLSPACFAVSKLHPGKRNLRAAAGDDATPAYNNAVLEDMLIVAHFRLLHATAAQSATFVQACILIKVWLTQRGLSRTPDSLNHFQASMLLLYLVHAGKLAMTASAETMFKVWLQFVATTDLAATALYFPASSHDDDTTTTIVDSVVPTPAGLAAFQAAFDVVLLGPSGRLNLLGRVSRSAWTELQWLAQQSWHVLPKATAEAFQFVFIDRHSIWTRYDEYIWVPVDAAAVSAYAPPSVAAGQGVDCVLPATVAAVAAQALGNRVHRVRALVAASKTMSEWSLAHAPPSLTKIALGLSLDPDHAQRIVDKGPEADDADAAASFRAFWQTKAELRRFKDGSIVEAVVWDDVPPSQIVAHVVAIIVPLHLPNVIADGAAITSSNQTWNEEAYNVAPLLKAWNALQATLRDVDDTALPLKVQDVQLIAPPLRRTAAHAPTPHPLAGGAAAKGAKFVTTTLDPYHVVLQFESSSSWPTTATAVAKAKLGFYVQLALVLEKHVTAVEVHATGVDVLLHGFPFRLVILTEREKAWPASQYYPLHYGALHATMIHALATRHAAYAPTVRLFRKWLDAHLASNVVPLESCELVVAAVFIAPSPPQSILSGFTRVLHLVAHFDWKAQPLIVDLHEHLTEDARREMQKQFDASQTSPSTHPALFVYASYEKDHPSFWTRHVTESVTSQRLVTLAKATATQWTHWLSHGAAPHGWQACFAHVMDYDVVFHLTTLGNEAVFPPSKGRFAVPYYKNLSQQASPFKTLFVGLRPLDDVVKQLHARFHHVALFFVNHEVIAVRWKPPAFLPTRFRVLHATHQLPLGGDDDDKTATSVPQVLQILHDMKHLLHGLVDRVELK
ncbi:Aste57867_12352 [Aphanomyces stellatus]|uniref:Aste57867_12352 protein n=1 Tax=Aphanomyces stellatus TaxID=120398 RepID=A0A485KXC1_9STRA|nr:hypothetical protein As57867_012306 [Aphanomyces stellatus]VFT89204.1 Aste57867_12352 [Aphanomyces stellatus]